MSNAQIIVAVLRMIFELVMALEAQGGGAGTGAEKKLIVLDAIRAYLDGENSGLWVKLEPFVSKNVERVLKIVRS